MTAAFVYQPPAPVPAASTHRLAVLLDRHPSNMEAAAIMGLTGFRSIERTAAGRAVVRFERFGRDAHALHEKLAAELRRLTTARIRTG